MAATSMMKEYLKKQLKYWVDNFKDDQLPRDFNSKNFSRPQIVLSKITLKPDKIASILNVPAPLIVTRATCSELTIKVPSWSVAEKFVQESLSLRLGDLFIDVKHFDECDDHVRKDSVARARAASMEPDPLGSIASMYQFGTVINERLEIMVENVYIKVYEKQALRVRIELAHFHARTTNAMWQDMRDLTDCVDRSPDGLLKTRFKFVSTQANVYLHQLGVQTNDQQAPPPLRLLRDHMIAMRMTLFGHRKSKNDSWETLSRVVDLNLDTLPFDMDVKQVFSVYEACCTFAKWINEAAARNPENGDHLMPHQIVRGPLTPTRKPGGSEAATSDKDNSDDIESDGADSTFALQVTVRFTAHMLLRIPSDFRGDLQVALIAQHVALNWIQHQSSSHEVQVTVHDISIRHKDKVLFHAKPAREAFQFKRLSSDGDTIFLKWHLQKLECHLENEIAIIANELFHSFNEIEQAASITCGTCHRKIPLDGIATHKCSAPASPNASSSVPASPTEPKPVGASISSLLNSTKIPKLRVVFKLDEVEIATDSHLFRTVHELMRRPKDLSEMKQPIPAPARRFVLRMNDFSVSTESKEFVGAAIFVPVLPLAFQMLECTIRGCGCVEQRQRKQRQRRKKDTTTTDEDPPPWVDDAGRTGSFCRVVPRWPDRVFAELGLLSMKSIDNATKTESFLVADTTSLRLSFSDGLKVCPQSSPQMSSFFHIERIRCQLEHRVFQRVRRFVGTLQDPLEGQRITALTLFFAVLEVRNVELTLLQDSRSDAANEPVPARLKAQFRQVGGVADNHLGRLSLQTNFDYRALLHSDSVQFDFQSHHHEPSGSIPAETKRERRRRREESMRVESTIKIQRAFRRFTTRRRQELDLELRRLTREDDELRGEDPITSTEMKPTPRVDSSRETASATSSSSSIKRRKSGGKAATSLFGAAAEDLAVINPMKMVAAAGVLKDGVMGFVKAKQQMIETEMGELATQSKESAARFIPKYSAVKSMLSPRLPFTTEDQGPGKNVEVRLAEVQSNGNATVASTDSSSVGDAIAEVDAVDSHQSPDVQHEQEEEQEGHDEEGTPHSDHSECDPDRETEERPVDEPDVTANDDGTEVDGSSDSTPPLSQTDAYLASLPPIVRLMVQVEEHRMCVPINPRESVKVLCSEIVRRFNEMFGNNGVISHVSLQNPQGGVFAGSDIVGLITDSTSNELFFAYPHEEDAEVKSVVHINLSPSPGKPEQSGDTSKSGSFQDKSKSKKHVCEFTRCSKLPLPLVVALLANETERDLVRHLMSTQGGGSANRSSTNGEEWPELALNTSFLDPTKEMLQIEVSWHGTSLQVTNADAFLLCLQQLGLGTSRANSKSVGKVLRDRLKIDTKNPLIRNACVASPEFQAEMASTESSESTGKVSYASLKEVVQEDYGVYMRSKGSM